MNNENKKEIKVKVNVVISKLPEIKEISYKEIGVGRTKIESKNKEKPSTAIDLEQLEREANESIF